MYTFGDVCRPLLVIVISVLLGTTLVAGQDDGLITDIDKLSGLADEEQTALAEDLYTRIKANTQTVVSSLLPQLDSTDINEDRLAIYIWALGIAEATESVDAIVRLATETSSDKIKARCLRALTEIGDERCGTYLLSTLDDISDDYLRFEAFTRLAQMQYAPALPAMMEILERDPKDLYWQPIFVFGMMGDVCVPYLLGKVNDESTDVRWNAIHLLGQWLMAPEANNALRDRFWVEDDPITRNLILSSIERTCLNNDTLLAFMQDVASKSDDKASATFAEEAIDLIQSVSEQMNVMKNMKQVSGDEFKKQFDAIYDSYGHDGDYQALFVCSSVDDEPGMKKLRERILQRGSDEAFYDYRKVNDVIYMNRVLANSR